MSCLNPIMAIYDGKRLHILNTWDYEHIEEIRTKYYDSLIELPCGKCVKCREAYANEKALRCACESETSIGNFFITLTYEHECKNKLEAKKDLKQFIDKVRKENPELKYFGCIERGDERNRIHAHVNFFNLTINDGRMLGIKFKSDHLEKLWGKGIIDIKPFDSGTARYTAGYTAGHTKKTLYITQSRNLGANYILKNKEQILKFNGRIYFRNQEYFVGRWAYKILKKFGSIDIEPIRKEQGINAKNRLIKTLKENNITYDQYIENKIKTAKLKTYKKKGGDNQ